MRIRPWALSVVLLLVLAPVAAFAQNYQATTNEHYDYIAVYYGGDFGGNLFKDSSSITDIGRGTPHTYGLGVGFWGSGMLSGELDFGYHPEFFGPKGEVGSDNNLITFTASFVINPTIDFGSQRIRPYVLLGGGLMRSQIKDFAILGHDTKNKGVVDAGGGIQYYFHPRVGIRGDVRYFVGVGGKNDSDGWGFIDKWDFFRGTVGIAFTF